MRKIKRRTERFYTNRHSIDFEENQVSLELAHPISRGYRQNPRTRRYVAIPPQTHNVFEFLSFLRHPTVDERKSLLDEDINFLEGVKKEIILADPTLLVHTVPSFSYRECSRGIRNSNRIKKIFREYMEGKLKEDQIAPKDRDAWELEGYAYNYRLDCGIKPLFSEASDPKAVWKEQHVANVNALFALFSDDDLVQIDAVLRENDLHRRVYSFLNRKNLQHVATTLNGGAVPEHRSFYQALTC
ncbi:MAG: hypothetical protein ACPGRX_00115 [Bdellovibrionales bacterium]